MTVENYAVCHVPTLRERICRKLGFRYHLGDDPEGVEQLEGWIRTDMRLEFSILDRIRLLFTGRLFIASIIHTDTKSPGVCKSRMDWRIYAPGERP